MYSGIGSHKQPYTGVQLVVNKMAPAMKKNEFKGVGQEMSLVYDQGTLAMVVDVPGLGTI